MDPVKKQMNSMYQPPLQQTGHKTSMLAIIILLIIAIIVAVLGFGRIKELKNEDLKANEAQQGMSQPRPAPKVDVDAELDTIMSTDSGSSTSDIDAAFK